MALSTSSSEASSGKGMSWRIWLIPLAVVLLFELGVRLLVSPNRDEKSNRTVLMNLVEQRGLPRAIMVGSSTFFTCLTDSEPTVFNLGLAGANSFTGLSILKQEGIYPEYLYIEMGINALAQCDGLHQPTMDILKGKDLALVRRKILYSTRKEYNLHLFLRRLVADLRGGRKARGNQIISESWKRRAMMEYLDRQKKRDSTGFFTRDRIAELLRQQSELIDHFIGMGVKVFLVRPPEEAEMYAARQYEYSQEEKFFNKEGHRWLDLNTVNEQFVTTDGYHLTGPSSILAFEKMLELTDYRESLR